MKEGLVETNSISASESETNEAELMEIINELKMLDSSQLPYVLRIVKGLRLGTESIQNNDDLSM